MFHQVCKYNIVFVLYLDGVYDVAIFLPPKSHLLMKLKKTESEGSICSIATDNWKILPFVANLIENDSS